MQSNIRKLASQIDFEMQQQGDQETKLCVGAIEKHFAIIEASYW